MNICRYLDAFIVLLRKTLLSLAYLWTISQFHSFFCQTEVLLVTITSTGMRICHFCRFLLVATLSIHWMLLFCMLLSKGWNSSFLDVSKQFSKRCSREICSIAKMLCSDIIQVYQNRFLVFCKPVWSIA